MAKDPVCGMIVDEKKPTSNPITWAKSTTSALPRARQRSTKILRNTLAVQWVIQGTPVAAAVKKATFKPFLYSRALAFFNALSTSSRIVKPPM